jgi:hypothetical protein
MSARVPSRRRWCSATRRAQRRNGSGGFVRDFDAPACERGATAARGGGPGEQRAQAIVGGRTPPVPGPERDADRARECIS